MLSFVFTSVHMNANSAGVDTKKIAYNKTDLEF